MVLVREVLPSVYVIKMENYTNAGEYEHTSLQRSKASINSELALCS